MSLLVKPKFILNSLLNLQALWLKPDDQFCTEMLNVALMDECQTGVDSTVELCWDFGQLKSTALF